MDDVDVMEVVHALQELMRPSFHLCGFIFDFFLSAQVPATEAEEVGRGDRSQTSYGIATLSQRKHTRQRRTPARASQLADVSMCACSANQVSEAHFANRGLEHHSQTDASFLGLDHLMQVEHSLL
jgi:hypothetical protein